MINMKKVPEAIYQSGSKISPCWRSVGFRDGCGGAMACAYKIIIPILWVVCLILMWGSWKVAYIGLDMYPILKLRNYNLIGGDAKIAPPKIPTDSLGDSFEEYGKIPKPVVVPHQGGVIWTLWHKDMVFFAFMEAGFLIIFPCLKFLFMAIVWFVPMRPRVFINMVRV